ncbi:Nucleotidylyl transferase [Saitoella complicata NRRL Y-17804]|uniref:Nucleotidylyl transferase n=1 Tax=Saitoella complicata (strain BCRC 22490 / CBS 7301 / JCM 7358 / NBRC 10748 / NRRL Y-17804) TaxID=698492 RepID=UPI0008681230|nr:Nucleotidylyl transferase [Saitoella complicata NRRL Y-17804]ODQ52887.1 Nucleotidylyl transferase [Saitoella complicata NRRL Y-17804]
MDTTILSAMIDRFQEDAKTGKETFQLISSSCETFPHTSPSSPTKTLYILDSSFNPPHRAHLALARIRKDGDTLANSPTLLLLATNNADKGAHPTAQLTRRLEMMEALRTSNLSDTTSAIAVTSYPYFVDKARVIRERWPDVNQVWPIGFDTFLRLLDPKYYPNHDLQAGFGDFFTYSRVIAITRPGEKWGEREEQESFLRAIRRGERSGVPKEWAERIEFEVLDRIRGISSTRIREAANAGDEEELGRLLPRGVLEYVVENGLYRDEDTTPSL